MAIEFLCDFCGSIVDYKDDTCKNCGAVFAAVKCPKCNYHGSLNSFANGCPNCNYNNPTRTKKKVFVKPWIIVLILLSISIFCMILILTNHV